MLLHALRRRAPAAPCSPLLMRAHAACSAGATRRRRPKRACDRAASRGVRGWATARGSGAAGGGRGDGSRAEARSRAAAGGSRQAQARPQRNATRRVSPIRDAMRHRLNVAVGRRMPTEASLCGRHVALAPARVGRAAQPCVSKRQPLYTLRLGRFVSAAARLCRARAGCARAAKCVAWQCGGRRASRVARAQHAARGGISGAGARPRCADLDRFSPADRPPSAAEPSRAEPSRAEPSDAKPGQARRAISSGAAGLAGLCVAVGVAASRR